MVDEDRFQMWRDISKSINHPFAIRCANGLPGETVSDNIFRVNEDHPGTPEQPWRPAPVITASAALHVAGLAALAADPASWMYVGTALAGNHALLTTAGMLPRNALLGPNLQRLPQAAAARNEIALTFDDGPDPVATPAILDLLDHHGAKASFFCIGRKAAVHADIIREIVRRGHSVENHSNHHPNAFACYGIGRLKREIEAAQETLAATAGQAPVYFRAPMGLRNPFLDPVLARLGLIYVSWTRRGFDTVDDNPDTVLARLSRNLAAGDMLLLHDGTAAGDRRRLPVACSVLPALLERIKAAGLRTVSLRAAFSGGTARS